MKVVILFLILFSLAISSKAQDKSKISIELNKIKITHSIESWQLASIKGDNKTDLLFEAIEYKALNSSKTMKGIKITLLPDNTQSVSINEFTKYIDYNNYAEIMVVINSMITDFKNKKSNKTHGSMTYSTANGIKFGFIFTEKTELCYISIANNKTKVSCELSDIESFLNSFLNYINIASKDLHLPENADKIKKVKKSNTEAKDATIDDI